MLDPGGSSLKFANRNVKYGDRILNFNGDIPNGTDAVKGAGDSTGTVSSCFRILPEYRVVILHDIPDDQDWEGTKGDDVDFLIFDNRDELNNAFSAHGLDYKNYMFSNLQKKTLYRDIVVLTYQDIVDTVIPMGLTLDLM